ncbi:MAG: hypothetical protein Q8O09_00390 [Bacillota bacterium]|nr:hypothetical protein [Bacillota bacterium]
MRRAFLQKILDDIKSGFVFYLSLAFFFFIGIAAGAFTALPYLQGTEFKSALFSMLMSVSSRGVNIGNSLAGALLNNIIWMGFIILGGINILLTPLLYITLLLEGFTFGFAASAFIGNFGFGGFIVVLLCVLPPSGLIAVCHAKACRIAMGNAVFRFKSRKAMGRRAPLFRELLIRFSGIAAITTLVSVLQAVVFPYLFQWLSKTLVPFSS